MHTTFQAPSQDDVNSTATTVTASRKLPTLCTNETINSLREPASFDEALRRCLRRGVPNEDHHVLYTGSHKGLHIYALLQMGNAGVRREGD